MRRWGEALLYSLYMPADTPHSNFGAWRAYVPPGRGAAVHASGCPPLQFWGLAYLCLGGLMCPWGEVLLYMPADAPHSISGLAYLGLGGLMCHWGEVPLYMPADAPHSNFGVWPIYENQHIIHLCNIIHLFNWI